MVAQALQENYTYPAVEKMLEFQCKQWAGARLKFKDVKEMEFNAAWNKIWDKGVAAAEKMAAKWKEDAETVTDITEAEKMATKIAHLKVIMPAKFTQILQ